MAGLLLADLLCGKLTTAVLRQYRTSNLVTSIKHLYCGITGTYEIFSQYIDTGKGDFDQLRILLIRSINIIRATSGEGNSTNRCYLEYTRHNEVHHKSEHQHSKPLYLVLFLTNRRVNLQPTPKRIHYYSANLNNSLARGYLMKIEYIPCVPSQSSLATH